VRNADAALAPILGTVLYCTVMQAMLGYGFTMAAGSASVARSQL
jgi:hypothetical protein